MTDFILTTSGAYFNAKDVDRISPAKGESKDSIIRLRGSGLEYAAWEKPDDLVQRLSFRYIPAHPGYALVARSTDCTLEAFGRWLTPVIAWRFSADEGWPTPITAEGAWDDCSPETLLIVQPNGTVVHLGHCSWRSLDEAYAELKAKAEPPA